ncbi:MAG: UDP-N-acetylglucosamine 1-carboxyvinyltransferase [Clostridiales Family XIII bacterium]|jgi:UDP-N-acetylglucosamine 1-carboxyvinyltransferase|nr:UDP-N-acetylglucosamine 1-carboxyvinyltransferase [Clostridiales Family XIII bacterium]
MAKYIIRQSLSLTGEVAISGSKNAVLPIMAAALLTDARCEITDVPALRDVDVMCGLMRGIGARVNERYGDRTIEITTEAIASEEAPNELVKKMRASILVMGPLLARTGRARIALPGGCAIGTRPIDLHLKGLKALGARIVSKDGYVIAAAERLRGANVYLDSPSVGATENITMAAALAEGTTVIENAAEEPEIVDMVNFLNKMGARIKGAGTNTIRIEGVARLGGAKHGVIPDRIETGTFMIAAAVTRGKVLIRNAVPDHVKPVTAKLGECGVDVRALDDGLIVDARHGVLRATDIKTLPYPGFPTDIQSQFMAFLTTVRGSSVVTENVFENRYMHVNELNRMGANIKIEGRVAIVEGERLLRGAEVFATDLRAGAALVLAGLSARGTTRISEIHHIERGYSAFVEKLKGLGADIVRAEE